MGEDDGKSGGGFLTGLLLGLLGGAALAMISSPQSGEETRDALSAKVREAAGRVRERAGEVSESVGGQTNELIERGRVIVERARARVDGAVAEGMDAAEQQRKELESRT
jgi:gas vesicle protein